MVVYITVIAFLLGRFKEPFYKLFAINGIVECVSWLFFYLVQRASHAPLFKSFYDGIAPEGQFMNVTYFLFGYFRFIIFFSSFFLSFNRFSILIFRTSYEQKWRRLVPVTVLAILLLPVCLSTDAILHGGRLVNEDIGYGIHPTNQEAETRLTAATLVVALVQTVSCTVMEATTGIYVMYRRRKAVALGGINSRSMELRLYLLSLKVFLGGVITLFVQVMFYLLHSQGEVTPTESLTLITIQWFVLDILFCANPWLLIAMSKQVRHELSAFLPPRITKDTNERVFSQRTVT